jgi:hypothetical protein
VRLRPWLGVLLVAAAVAAWPGGAAADEAERLRLARELTSTALAGEMRERLQAQLVVLTTQSIGRAIQIQLNRRFLEVEWRIVERLVTRFLGEALPPPQLEQIYAEIYADLFDEDELRELVRFHRTSAGRKSLQLQGRIGRDALEAMSRVVDRSPARATLIAELRKEFPALGPAESP